MTMNNQFGPPLRFKAVNTETGEESGPFKMFLPQIARKMSLVSGNFLVCETDEFQVPENMQQYDGFDKNLTICQSTGLHDSRGVEIYGGDVLLADFKDGSRDFATVIFKDGEFLIDPWTNGPRSRWGFYSLEYSLSVDFVSFQVIGNKWMPEHELKRRAEDV